MKYKIGDRVRVKNFDKRPLSWNDEGHMDHLMGEAGVVYKRSSLGVYTYKIKFDCGDYHNGHPNDWWSFQENQLNPDVLEDSLFEI